ncbi:BTB/POZ domain-containing protein 17 isoform X3, partial [Biomphalaria glabrata]
AKELLLVEQNDLYQDKELGPLLKKLMGMAYRFHVFCRHQTELVVSFAQDFYQPRNYLDLAVDNVHIQRNMRDAAEIDVKIYGGLAFLGSYDGDWKVYYKKYKEAWVVNTQCYKTASQVGAAQVQCVLIITNKDDQVLQVKESEVTVSARGAHLSVQAVLNMDLSKSMAVLFKPIPK